MSTKATLQIVLKRDIKLNKRKKKLKTLKF